MTARQYQLLLDLYHEYPVAFDSLAPFVRGEFYAILFGRKVAAS